MKRIDLHKGFLNLDYHIGKIFFFFLTWKNEIKRKFFLGLFYVRNGESTALALEV